MASVCKKNAQIAATIGRKDLVNMWNLVALAASPPSSETTQYYVDWNKHPFAREMIESMLVNLAFFFLFITAYSCLILNTI